jgi:hypothetical protein
MTPLRQIGRRKNLPRIALTHGEWADVKTLERAKAKGLYRLPWRASLRKTSKSKCVLHG